MEIVKRAIKKMQNRTNPEPRIVSRKHIFMGLPLAVVIIIFSLVSCSGKSTPVDEPTAPIQVEEDSVQYLTINDTIISFKRGDFKVEVAYKQRDSIEISRGNIILLPGWNYAAEEWCTKTDFCDKALALGYNLILPEMEKSVYASEVHPETRVDMKRYATRTWMLDTLIPFFQRYGLLLEGERNYVLGLSTGGRGAALLCLDRPTIFTKGASLSGDYNQASMPKDNLMRIFYGPFDAYKERWTGNDNVYYCADRFNVPFYLGHGKLDEIVPVAQTMEFYAKLKEVKSTLELRLHIDSNAVHDYNYWNSEVDNVLDFFQE